MHLKKELMFQHAMSILTLLLILKLHFIANI